MSNDVVFGPRLSGSSAKKRYKQAVAKLPKPVGALEPTLPERINRLNPSERAQVANLIRSLKLRKIIRRTLAEAFWAREANELEQVTRIMGHEPASMRRLKAAVRSQESLANYERALTPSVDAVDLSTQLAIRGPGLVEID